MRIVRVAALEQIFYGIADRSGVHVFHGTPFTEWEPTDRLVPWAQTTLLSPVVPGNLWGVGRNYDEHVTEFDRDRPQEPVVFMKPPLSVVGPNAPVIHPTTSTDVHFEAELAVVISKPASDVEPGDAYDYVLGYTAANDVTARDLQKIDGQWTRAKGFRTFCPLGPVIDTTVEPERGVTVTCRVNGETRQSATTTDLLFDVPAIIASISLFTTLLPGDVILTGTPAGVGKIVPGDVMEVEVEGIGVLRNPVVAG